MRSSVFLLALLLAGPALAQQHTLLLWPNGNPEPSKVVGPEIDPTTDANRIVSGKVTIRVTNVSKPSLAVYSPDPAKNNGAAALVFPGGSYIRLSYNLEGTEVCDWLNSLGMTCVLVKYRVPEDGHYPENVEDLEDAQQAMRLTRTHASEWHIDSNRIGVIGFSAGAHLAAVLSTHPDFQGKNIPASSIDARPNFQMILYPGWLNGSDGKVNSSLAPTPQIPPTFLLQAENDYTAHVENVLVYFQALKDANVPAELHVFTQGGPRLRFASDRTSYLTLACAGRNLAAHDPHPWACAGRNLAAHDPHPWVTGTHWPSMIREAMAGETRGCARTRGE